MNVGKRKEGVVYVTLLNEGTIVADNQAKGTQNGEMDIRPVLRDGKAPRCSACAMWTFAFWDRPRSACRAPFRRNED